MADYVADGPVHESPEWGLYHLSEHLEDHSIRHCIAGDAIISILGYPLVVCDLYLAVADEQLEDALTVILQQGCQQTGGRDCYVDKKATIAPLGWPGYRLTSSELLPATVMLVPASFWHMDLSVSSLSENTFLHPTTQCRFPKRLFYLDALVNAIVDGALKPGWNILVSGYFEMKYHYLLACLSPDTLIGLPPEDRFFVDLYGRLLPPSTRQKVCFNQQQIRHGLMTVEDAWKSIPRKALEFDALQRKIRNHG
ncbi:hypothetical protein POJ06DRAFT_264490 [Lipomyces tetrasporus]|uniref:Uncharacterized protein n=1 Tax=Lipomyces tetrasporus TaxID=54092 RepID=A0AAD7QY93_9ASCO|nr:uncharacterized protein POJ06DRAFT_264490 [Lipomyces tetrasporus]KAJ8103663.1 hypothetical protein POJ06DRAFT_264490 [Lipomyces tetrasporus]